MKTVFSILLCLFVAVFSLETMAKDVCSPDSTLKELLEAGGTSHALLSTSSTHPDKTDDGPSLRICESDNSLICIDWVGRVFALPFCGPGLSKCEKFVQKGTIQLDPKTGLVRGLELPKEVKKGGFSYFVGPTHIYRPIKESSLYPYFVEVLNLFLLGKVQINQKRTAYEIGTESTGIRHLVVSMLNILNSSGKMLNCSFTKNLRKVGYWRKVKVPSR